MLDISIAELSATAGPTEDGIIIGGGIEYSLGESSYTNLGFSEDLHILRKDMDGDDAVFTDVTDLAVSGTPFPAFGTLSGGDDTGGEFANLSSNAVRIERNGDVAAERSVGTRSVIDNGFEAIRDQFSSAHQDDQFNRICARIQDTDNRSSDQRFQSELRTNDRLLALQAEMNENARDAAKCCCDLKLQMCEDKSSLLSAIAAVESRGIERSLNTATARITQLETINALTAANFPTVK